MKIGPPPPPMRDLATGHTPVRQASRVPAAGAPVGSSVELSLSSQARSQEAARAIMQGHSLRSIRYTELVAVADQLRQAGALRAEDYLDFIGPSPEHARLDGSRDPDWNNVKDHVTLREQQVASLKATHAEQRFIDFAEYHLGLYRYYESLNER